MAVRHVTEEEKKCSTANCDFDVMFPHITIVFSKEDISDPPVFPVASFPIIILLITKRSCILLSHSVSRHKSQWRAASLLQVHYQSRAPSVQGNWTASINTWTAKRMDKGLRMAHGAFCFDQLIVAASVLSPLIKQRSKSHLLEMQSSICSSPILTSPVYQVF